MRLSMIVRSRHFRGFSLVEVMFAVVILGIGVTLVASIFPVAIEQTRNNMDDAAAAQLARDAMQFITVNTNIDDYPAGGSMVAFSGTTALWNKVCSNLISPTDPRYAWVPYCCKRADGSVLITVVIVKRSIHGTYTTSDANCGSGELVPRGINISNVVTQPSGVNYIQILKSDALGYSAAMAPNALLVVGSGATPGTVLRVGDKVSETADVATWTLQSTGAQASEDVMSAGFANTIGRDWVNPKVAPTDASGYDGPAQDIAAYTSIIVPAAR